MYSAAASRPSAARPFPRSPTTHFFSILAPSQPIRLPSIAYPKLGRPEAAAHSLSGLRTPPLEDMGTTYHAPNLAPYEGHPHASLAGYSASLAQTDRTRSTLSDVHAALDGYSRYPPHTQQASGRPSLQIPQQAQSQAPSQPHTHATQYRQPQQASAVPRPSLSSASYPPSQTSSFSSSHPGTPKSGRSVASQGTMSRKDVASLAGQSLDIPKCISTKGGRLADLAAQLTCFFWFEARNIHQLAEKFETLQGTEPVRRLTQHALPSQNFKAWVHGILSTTQVTQNVVILALLFIHRLKVGNPNVKGRPGSEYRLLTVALMLGNKFLDDNTYTNKTWAEVSGISVQEIHVMEVEFLSNMRYSLLVSKEKWEEWLVKMARFWEYCEAATKPVSPIAIPSPTHFPTATSPVESPTSHLLLTPSIHSTTTTYSPNYGPPSQPAYAGSSQWPSAATNCQSLSPLAGKPDARNGFAKRPLCDEDPTEPPAKRMSRQPQPLPPHQGLALPGQQRPASSVVPPEALRLPTPNLTLNTNQQVPTTAAYNSGTSHAPAQQSALSLPPLVPGVRAMSTVYPTTTSTNYSQNVMATSGPMAQTVAPSVTTPIATSASGFPPTTNYGTPTKRHSPGSLTPAAAAALGNSSPLTESFAHGHPGVRTPISHSPSVYLQHRASPYRPVRHFNTLLYPPPSASLHEYHLSGSGMIPPTQMHYQPLGRRNEYRTGIVPEFTMSAQQQQQQQYARQGGSVTPLFPTNPPSHQHQQHQQPQQRSMLGHGQTHDHPQHHMHYPN
ncbi:hypothetical protein MAPG_04311 [Magnaporthiopsis poae ATCC 64411]|uniref:Meiotically up-regulated 80 protein n=1 Tax=Magnaporthiopsis poae (strain ATCC 64411 / 73-15) TaxID=644358 RepID=A0A0C4DWD5_MAGP6|nr:hypothetical protein MAPG_04311 [Magnaporthiopsis poae ATCC 64411]